MELIKIIEVTDPEIIKKFQASRDKNEKLREGIRQGRKISELAEELGFEFCQPLKDDGKEKKKKVVIELIKEVNMKTKQKYKR